MSDLDPVVYRLEHVEDPLDRAVAAQREIARLAVVRDEAMRQAWLLRPAGSSIGALARAVGVTRTAAALAVSRGGQA